jgi:UDP-N-acetylmuramate dehydrogenase
MISTQSDSSLRLFSKYIDRIRKNVELSRFTASRIGGLADYLIEVFSSEELSDVVSSLWEADEDFTLLGSGSNVLISDKGIRGVVILNHAKKIRLDVESEPFIVWAESGANFGSLARQVASKGFSGLEWAAGVPGTVGGAVVGNAGAHDGDVGKSLYLAEILHLINGERRSFRKEKWLPARFEYSYRYSILKEAKIKDVVLSAGFRLRKGDAIVMMKKMDEFVAYRKRTQPPGASMGSMFKNPPGDYAGRLIEAAGLKGMQIGDAEISSLHANFFVNHGHAKALDVMRLIQIAQEKIYNKFGVKLQLEIELLGDWQELEQ